MKIAVITDSGSNIFKDFVTKHPNLFVIPLMIIVDNKAYKDQVEITAQEVYEQLDDKTITTSLPETSELLRILDKLKKEEYTDVLIINISSGLSGTYNAFRVAIEDYSGLNIFQYDTKTLGAGQGYLVERALELITKKTKPEDILLALDKERFTSSLAMYTINTLKYLKRGGRIGKVEGTIGDILHIKPVITVNDEGVYITLSKTFGINKALIRMRESLLKKFEQNLIDLTIHYGTDLDTANKLANTLKNHLNIRNLTVSQLTPVLGIHTGPMMFAYVARLV